MNGSDIKALLDGCISGGVLTLTKGANPLQSSRIDALLGAMFGNTLTAGVSDQKIGATSVTYLGASLDTQHFALYPQTGPVSATVTVATGAGGMLDLSVQATMPADWTFAASFAQLAQIDTPLNKLVLSAATIAVDSATSSDAGAVTATITTAQSAIAQFAWLFGADVTVTGPVDFVTSAGTSYPRFTLASPQINGPDISGFSFAVYLNLRCLPGQTAVTAGGLPLLTAIDLTSDLITPALTLPILIGITGSDQIRYLVSLDPFSPPLTLAGLGDLVGFTLNQNPSSALANTPIGSKLSIPTLSIVFDAASKSLSNLQVTVDLDAGWTVINNILVLQDLKADFFVPVVYGGSNPPSQASFSVTVTAEFIIAETADIDVSISYPDETAALALAPGSGIDINDFLGQLAPGVKLPGSGDLTIVTLSALADIKNSAYRFSCEVDGNLSIIPKLTLTEMDLAAAYANGAMSSFQFGSMFTIADAPLYLAVTWSSGGNWMLSGGSQPGQPINLSQLVADILSIFNVQLPTDLPKIVLSPLDMTYQTQPGSFTFDATISYVDETDPVLKSIEGKVSIAYGGTAAPTWTGDISGSIALGNNLLTVAYDFHATQVVSLSWQATGDETLGIDDLCKLFGVSAPPIPSDLDLALTFLSGKYDITNQRVVFEATSKNWGKADVVVWNDKTTGWMVFFGVDISRGGKGVLISLTDLPLIGKALASVVGDVALDEIVADLANGALTADQAKAIGEDIDAGYPKPPDAGLPSGVALTMMFDAGGDKTQISLGTGNGGGQQLAAEAVPAAPATVGQRIPGPPGQATPATSSDGTKWFALQKTFGPVSIQKVGVRYDSKAQLLWALMNASLSAGGLTIDLLGLGVGSPLTTFSPHFTVDGIAITVQEGPVAISGGLVGGIDPVDLYGEMSLDFGNFCIGALAGYKQLQDGHPSFFLYAVLDAPIGGPAFAFVTGLAAGFGYNRSLVIPDVSGVYTFPLVQWAVGINAPSSDPSGNVGEQVSNTLSLLATSGVVAPEIGEYWLAAGIRFTSFELVDSFALLTFKFGNEFEIDILGLSTLKLPPAPATPFAEVQLALKASFSLGTGLLAIAGQLTPNSYVIDTACHLTGGFAFYLWLAGEHEGDFVATLGGYNPNYTPPKYYPQVPRLGLNWKIGDCLTISGDLYFALTSSAVMAGGGMSAVWQAGDIRAWFSVQADFLMVFTPFHYYMSGSIELGASVRISLLFTHITISIHLGVGVELWGPSFSGEVDVDLSIVSFTIGFGSGQKGGNTKIAWNDFVGQLLPSQGQKQKLLARAADAAAADSDPPAVLQFAPVQGVTKTLSDAPAGPGVLNWLVDETFQVTVQSTIPFKTYQLDGPLVVLAPQSMQPQSNGTPIVPNQAFGVGPTDTDPTSFTSCIEIGGTSTEDSTLDAVMVLKNIPKSLWEKRTFDPNTAVPQNVDPVNDTTISNVLTGFTLVPTPPTPGQTRPIPIEYLKYTIDSHLQQFSWSVPVVETTDPFTTQTVAATIGASPATVNRPALIAAINRAWPKVDTVVDVSLLASAATSYLLAAPMLRYLGEAR